MRHDLTYAMLFALLYLVTLSVAWLRPPWLGALRNFVFDPYQWIEAPPYDPASPVRIVAVDERSLKALGQWPWPRSRLTEMVERLGSLGASAIAFDVIFAEPDRVSLENVIESLPDGPMKTDLKQRFDPSQSNDSRFARALAGRPIALGVTASEQGAPAAFPAKAGFVVAGDAPEGFVPTFPSVVMPIPVLREAASGLGATNWLPDHDQIVRRVPLLLRSGDAYVPSLAMEALRLAQGASTYVLRASNASGATAFGRATGLNAIKVGDIEVGTGADGSVRPRYTHTDARRYIPAADLLAGTVQPDDVRGRIMLVGTPVVGLGDVRATPLDAAVPGVEIHAQVIEQLLSGALLYRPDWSVGLETSATLLFLTLLATTLHRMRPGLAALLSLAAITMISAGSWLAFRRLSLLLDPAFPSIVIGTAYLSGASALWQAEQRARRQIRRAFGKFVAPAVVARIADNPRLLVLNGEARELTILFSDLRGFSTISETLTAQEVAQFLNKYLTPMTDVILHHEGTVDKYIGDAIVAFWNAPVDVPNHTVRAVEAALAMRKALADFNAEQASLAARGQKVVQNVRMGVGLNFGTCNVGNMGSLQRFDYSALGDPMNVAARLEALTKTYNVDVLATLGVVERTSRCAWLEIDEVQVKGRAATTRLFTIFGDEAHAALPAFRAWAECHEAMRAASRAGRWPAAEAGARDLAARAESLWRPLYENLAARYAEASRSNQEVIEPADVAHLQDAT